MNTLVALIERVGASRGGDAYFSAAEVAQWPAAAAKALADAGLLSPASPADSMECPGCEQSCFMPVHVLPGTSAEPARAFIGCETRNDIGRVAVPVAGLERMKSSGRAVAEAITGLLKIQPSSPTQLEGGHWRLGTLKGARHKASIGLVLGIEPQIEAGGHLLRLVDLLDLSKDGLTVDLAAVRKCVDNPTGGTTTNERPADRAARYRERMKELQASGVKDYRKQLAAEEGLDPSRIGQLLRKYKETPAPANTWHPGGASPQLTSPPRRRRK